MPAPEIWGPAVWTLFHALIEHLNEDSYQVVAPQLYAQFVRICKFLPCPDCAADATNFLAKINFATIKSKVEFRNTFYLFHNWVNAKKRKPLFNYSNITVYGKYNIIVVINRFLSVYHTKGNMKMLNESFQRNMVTSNFKQWIMSFMPAFMQPAPVPTPVSKTTVEEVKVEEPVSKATVEEVKVEEPVSKTTVEEVKVEEPVSEATVEEVKVEEPVVEEIKVEEPVSEANVEEIKVEEPVSEANVEEIKVEEPVSEATVEEPLEETVEKSLEETVVEEPLEETVEESVVSNATIEEAKPKGNKGRKGKK